MREKIFCFEVLARADDIYLHCEHPVPPYYSLLDIIYHDHTHSTQGRIQGNKYEGAYDSLRSQTFSIECLI